MLALLTGQNINLRKVIIFIFTSYFYFSINGCAQKDNSGNDEHKYTNALINETSPYLIQHAHNPVNWYPWSDVALTKAKDEKKLMVISIGYSACHWCHVMEHESYEDSTVAALMNANYVSIKIDREERPDIDQVYIDAAQLLNGNAGWPLNVIALPDATPVFVGTYFPKDQWMNVLTRIQEIYDTEPERLFEQSKKIMEGLKEYNAENVADASNISSDEVSRAMNQWMTRMDTKHGGLQSSQKFPLPGGYLQMLNYSITTNNAKMQKSVELTLDKMALGGLYDHVGGGFHRYTVEETWKIPHFEKMLYDNGQLVSLYAAGYQVFKNPMYKDVLTKTLKFIEDEMTDDSGGFYSSFDADSDGEEGKFYIWHDQEIDELLGKDAALFKEYFTISKRGNWEEEKNILYAKKSKYDFFTDKQLNRSLEENLELLKRQRSQRVAPGLDDKILTAWNALMMKGLIDAYKATEVEKYLEMAKKNAAFIRDNQLNEDGRLNRNYKDGTSSINGFLDDYAFTIQAYLSLYQVTFDKQWLELAQKLTAYCMDHFYVEERNLFRYKSDLDKALILEKFTVNDNVIPSGNSTMSVNLLVLGNMYYDTRKDYLVISQKMQSMIANDFKEAPFYHYGWLPGFQMLHNGFYEIAIVGEDYDALRRGLQKTYVPNGIYLGGKEENLPLLENKLVPGKTFIYVCKEKYCKLPVRSVSDALALIDIP